MLHLFVFVLSVRAGLNNGAFSYCNGLTEITIPDSVTSIGKWAFSNCIGLKGVTIESGTIGDYEFSSCSNLKSVTIGSSVTSIGIRAFEFCDGLTEITIPDSVTSIGDWAFDECSELKSVTIGRGVTLIGRGAFSMCDLLENVTFVEPHEWGEYDYYGDSTVPDIVYTPEELSDPTFAAGLFSSNYYYFKRGV